MGHALYHALGLAASLLAALRLGEMAGLHPLLGTLGAAAFYLEGRLVMRRVTDAFTRRRAMAGLGLEGRDASRVAHALEALDRGNPDIARATLAAPASTGAPGDLVHRLYLRACLRLVTDPRFGGADAANWAGITAGRRRPVPHLERALLAPGLEAETAAVAAEAALVEDDTLAEILRSRRLLAEGLLRAVGRPLDPMFARAEWDLEAMLGRRFLFAPRSRLRRAARELQPRRPLPPREEAAALLLLHGREDAAAALLAAADFAGTLSRRGRALRTAAVILRFRRAESELVVSPEMFARHTREIFFLHTRDVGMTWGSPYLDGFDSGAGRLLELLREKHRFVDVLSVMRVRRGRPGRALDPLLRRVAAGSRSGETVPRSPRRFLRWWRERGRRLDDACEANLRGLVLMQERRPAEAAAEFERALRCDPWFAEAAYNLAWARSDGRQHEGDPAEPLRRAAEAEPESPAAWLLLGEFLDRQDRSAEAEDCFRRVLRTDPMHFEANLYLGRLLLAASRLEEAADALRRSLTTRPAQADVMVSLAVVHLEAARPADAVPLLRAAIAEGEGDRREEARYLLHIALKEEQRHDEALTVLGSVPDRFLRRHEHLLEEAAIYLEERFQFDRSQRLFERLREIRARRGDL